jgi:hypothetical protein
VAEWLAMAIGTGREAIPTAPRLYRGQSEGWKRAVAPAGDSPVRLEVFNGEAHRGRYGGMIAERACRLQQ